MPAARNAGNANAAPPAAKGGFNKLFVMVPVMLAARKLDAEDPNTVHWLRIAYGSMQSICLLVVLYTFLKASSLKEGGTSDIVYVPAAPTPFEAPDAKKKYTQVEYRTYIISTARSLLGSTVFGIAMSVGLHIYKGMAMGLAIQTIMGPLNLVENPLVKALLFGNGFVRDDKIFEEKSITELTDDDEVVDESGNPVSKQALVSASNGAVKDVKKKTISQEDVFEELVLDTWDAGSNADIAAFVSAITEQNCNSRTKENGWTPLMILSGLTTTNTKSDNDDEGSIVSAIKHVIAVGGNPAITDGEGWNALHWAAFHGSLSAAKVLYEQDQSLLKTKDKEGKLPLEMALSEGNKDVATYLEEVAAAAKNDTDNNKEGLRKRK